MIKVLVAALVGTIVGIVVMVVVIAISGTNTSGATSVGIGPLPLSTYSSTPSTSTPSTPTSSGGGSTGGGSTGATGDATAGKAVWDSSGCGSCHTLASAGSTGAVGPNLDTALAGDAGSTPLPAFVLESIVNPEKVIAKGYNGGIMPPDFGSKLSTTDLNNLVALILQGK